MAPQNDPLNELNSQQNSQNPTPQTPSSNPQQPSPTPAQEIPQKTSSVVDTLIAEANDENTSAFQEAFSPENTGTSENAEIAGNTQSTSQNSLRKPASPKLILQYIGSLLLIFTIIFATFISYIVLNPAQSTFFITIFGIDPVDVAELLKWLVNISFGIVLTIVVVFWVITLFRAIWTPKKYKRKRVFNWILAGITMLVLLILMSIWIVIFNRINATNFANPGGNIIAYDNALYTNESTQDIAQITDFRNLIGPITLRYDISENAERLEKSKAVKIKNYEINFDDADCVGGDSIIRRSDPSNDEGIICTFDEVRSYTLRGEYTVETQLGETRTVEIEIEPVEIKGNLEITEQPNAQGEEIITYDATNLITTFGTPIWTYLNDRENPREKSVITEVASDTPLRVCFTIFQSSRENKNLICDRVFVIQNKNLADIQGEIVGIENTARDREYTFSLEGTNFTEKEITKVVWKIDKSASCATNEHNKCIYLFSNYGIHDIEATVYLASNQEFTFTKKLPIIEPLDLARHAEIKTIRGQLLNTESTFSQQDDAYVITRLEVPSKIILDAQDVISENLGYTLDEVTWTVAKDGKTETLTGKKVEYTIDRSIRHTILAQYIFKKNIPTGNSDDTMKAGDTIYINIEQGNLNPKLEIDYKSDYVPVTIVADASQSQAENSEIIEFQYDFGEGKPVSSGDGVKKYTYTTPGKKTITLTMINEAGEKATATKTIILKATPKTVQFTTSLSPATAGNPVDFIAEGSNGQVEDYIWNFGDNSDIETGYDITHTFKNPGNYQVTLTVRYTDGTEDSLTKTFTVVDSLN